MIDVFKNICGCYRRLSQNSGLRSFRIKFSMVKPASWSWGKSKKLCWGLGRTRLCHYKSQDLKNVLRHVALLRNVGEAKIILPKINQDDPELQALVHDCEQGMMTQREQDARKEILKDDAQAASREGNSLDEAGFGPTFHQEQRLEDQWDKMLLDIMPVAGKTAACGYYG